MRAILPTPAIGGARRAGRRGPGGRPRARARARPRAGRRDQGLARPVALAARDRRPRGGRPAAGRPGRRARATATSCARRILAGAGRAPATTCPMAGCWSRWPKWRWPAAPAPRLAAGPRGICPAMPTGSARTRPATCWRCRTPALAGPRRRGRRRAGDADRPMRRRGLDTARWAVHIGASAARRRMSASSRLDGRPAECGERERMAMQPASEIEALIKAALPDAQRHDRGPGRRRRPLRRDRRLRAVPRQEPRAAAPDRLCRAARPDGRRAARPRAADLSPR